MKLHYAKVSLALSSALLLAGFSTVPAFAQDEPDTPSAETQKPEPETALPGFQGVKWGDSIDTAREKISNLKEFTFSPEQSDKESLFYTGGELGNQKISVMGLFFSDEGFFKSVIYFKGDENKMFSQYKEIQDLLNRKYGKPADDKRVFFNPYEEGDGYEKQAVRLGKAVIFSLWWFKEEGKPESEKSGLLLEIKDSLAVALSYENTPRQKRWAEKKKEEKAKDF